MYMKRINVTIFLLFFSCLPIFCQDKNSDKIHVLLRVSGEEKYKDMVYSYLARELRSLNDVVIDDKLARYELYFVVLAPTYKTGEETGGITISTAILDNFNRTFVELMVFNSIKDEPLVKEVLETLTTFCDLWANTGSIKELKQICESIIADFDTKYLEKLRKFEQTKKKTLDN